MKNLLNLKGLCRSSQLALNPDGQPTVNRRSRLMSIICLFLFLTLGVGQMWAYWHVPGTHASTGWTSADGNESCMNGDNYVTFYAVAAGTYEFKLVKGNDWGNGNFTNKSSSIITSVCSKCSGDDNNKFVINTIADVTFHITNEGLWNCDISAVASSYFIKYPWGDNHAWTFSAPMTACSDGTYACTGPYNGTTYDFGRRGYAGGAGAKTGQTATVNNSPSKDETCVFNVTTSGALTITRCNKVTATNKIYFDNSVSNFTGNIYLIIGHDKPTKFSCAYKMTQLAGTKLHYVSVDANWTDATYYAIVGNSAASIAAGSWGSESLSTKQTGGYTAAYTGKYDLDGSNKQYLFTTASSGNGQALTITYKNTGYSNLNYTQSVTLCTKAYGADTYSANTSSLTSLNFTTYNLTGVGSVSTQQTNNMNGSTGVASGSACQAATTTINVGDAPASWVYDGIYTAMNGGSQVEDDQEYTYYPRAATNYYVRFHEVHDPSVSLAASSAYLTTTGGLRALKGETITLTATALYNVNSLVYTYEYSTNGGSSWTTIASRSASNTQTFTANSTGDYIFRVTLPDEAGTVNGTTNVHMTEMYTIKVKKNSNWVPNKLYVWNKSTEITQYGAFPGSTGKFTNHGQWYEFELNSDFDSFIVSASNHDTNRTSDVNNVTGDGCYTINAGTGTSCAVTSGAACPSVPTVTASAATSVLNTKATLNGNISATGNDALTDYGFYWSTTYTTAETLKSSGTQVQKGTSDHTGAIAHELTGLSAGSTVYYIAYATNGQGTTVSDVQTFTTEGMHNVTVNAETGGTVSYNGGEAGSTCTARAGIETASANIVATANEGYYFVGWQLPDGTITKASETSYDGVTQTITIKATADSKTVTALFNVRYALLGSVDTDGDPTAGMPGWGGGNEAPFTYSEGTYTKTVDLTLPNTTYKFKIVDRRGATHTSYGLSSKAVIPADINFHPVASTAADAQLATAGVGTYTLTVQTIAAGDNAGKPQVKITNPASHLITMGVKTDFGANDAAGGSISAVDGEATPNVITNGKYIKDGGTIVVTATPRTGYSLAGWYSDAACTSAYTAEANVAIDDEAKTLTLSNLNDNKTIYAKFTENRTTVTVEANNAHGTVTIAEGAGRTDETHASVGVYTTASVTAVPDAGYYFAGWTLSNETFTASGTGEANTTMTITGAGTAGTSGTLTANFVELDKIYFRNIFDDGAGNISHWSDVYVYLGITWNGYKQAVTNSSNDSWRIHMSQITGTDVWWAYVPRNYSTSNNYNIGFASTNINGRSYTFYDCKAATRGDYNKALNMFVPYHTPNQTNNNGVDYYSNGYWMKYDTRASQGAGYYLKVYNSRNNYTEKGEFTANTDDATMIRFQVRVDNTNADKTRFMITSAGGLNYLAAATPTSTANSDIDLNEDTRAVADNDVYFQLTATSEGFYTFILDQTGDKMKLTVDYPVSPGDYRLKHTYVGKNKANTADSTYITYSDVIKASTAGTAKTYSMYLNTGGTETLVLQKCERINTTTKLPEWSEGDATNLDGILSKLGIDGNGVYQFDITVNTSSNQVSEAVNIGKYTGNYYIKTDCAPGGWVNYTQNAMEANTINATAAGYDYYFLKWIDNTSTNVKCVIANDYCNELSDTLKSDAILTRKGEAYQTLPEAASVRFSYDSKTNTLKRTYLRGSTLSENFVTLVPNAAEYVYSAKTSGTDYYSSNPKFADNGNWTYQMDAYVYPGAKGGVQTSYPGAAPVTTQILVPMDNDLMGGTKPVSDPVRYHVRLVYDFKTDYLMAAYIPDATTPITTEIDLQSDMMYVRSGVSNGTQLSFDENNGKLTHVRRAYAAIQLPKDEMVGKMNTWNANDYRAYKYCRYYISFPFDVNVRDIFGVGTFGNEYIIKMYNGAKRAQIGWFAETETFWETLTIDSVLHAYQGYCLMLDRNAFNDASNGVWTNIGTGGSTFLYFPSSSTTIGEINGNGGIIPVPTHTCTIDRTFGTPVKNHKNTDSNWNLMGFAPYANAEKTGETLAYYVYEPEGNSWTSATTEETNNFNSMHAYMVQWGGNFNYIQAPDVPSSVAARRVKAQKKNDFIRLELLYNGAEADHASIKMTDGVDKDFVLNEDMGKIINSGKPNIYVYAGNYDVAFSQVPEESQTVQVGVVIRKNGTYTFSMPDNFDGTVTLIDNFTQTRTNLAIEDYEVSLPKGTINDRFLLEINIRQVPTAIDGVEGGSLKDGKAHKYIENGVMYILRDGQVFDARGNKVK